ncbi:MAG: response regulator [Chlorobiaceae bacterium]|nr:response regulator [Chlorobiaceae bacterium]
MEENKPNTGDFSELRYQAEKQLAETHDETPNVSGSDGELRRLIHELSVHQIELEMQKEELQQTAENLAKSRIELQNALDRYADHYDFAPVGYITITRNGIIIDANLTSAKLLDVERGVLKGLRFDVFVADDDLPGFNAFMELVCKYNTPGNYHVRLRNTRQYSEQWTQGNSATDLITVRIDASLSNNGEICRLALSDISRQKEIELENASLQENLAQAQKMDSIGRLAGGIAHDYNNMLAAILGNAELALRKADRDHPMRKELETIIKVAQRSAELTRQLLGFARKQDVLPKIFLLDSAIESSLEMLRRLIGENIVVDWQPSNEMDYVRMDPVQIDQILINLCVNAHDAIIGSGRITIRTEKVHLTPSDCNQGNCCNKPEDYVRLSVTDNGAGIDKQTLPHIYEPFFTTKALGQGTGLGLSTIYGIVKQNFGFLECTSEPGKGTSFVIYLPLYNTVVQDEEYLPQAKDVSSGKESILIVEDEPDILTVVKNILESSGYSVHAALTPSEAIRKASENPEIRLLLTDVVMPEINGSELAQKLKLMIPNLKIIFMSGYTADVIGGHVVLDNEVNFIQKPFSVTNLIKTVKKALKS